MGSCFSDLSPKVSLSGLKSRLLFFVGDASLSSVCAFTNLCVPFLMLLILVGSSAGTRSQHKALSFRVGRSQANVAPIPDQSQTLYHDLSSN